MANENDEKVANHPTGPNKNDPWKKDWGGGGTSLPLLELSNGKKNPENNTTKNLQAVRSE